MLGLLPVTGAQAQWYSSYPQAPGSAASAPPQQPYAVEVAPNTYVIHRPDKTRATTHVRCVKDCEQPASERPRTHANRELIEELVKRSTKTKVVNTTKVVREKPVVIEHERVVDDPPRVIERRHITEDAPGRGLIKHRREVGQEDVVIEPGGAPAEAKRSAKGQARGARSQNERAQRVHRQARHPRGGRGHHSRARPHEHPAVPQGSQRRP